MYGYVYLTTNTVNNNKYIGQHTSQVFDSKYLGSGTALKNAIQKYGKKKFKCEILCECFSQDDLDYKERLYIEKFNACNRDDYYNIAVGGKMCQLVHHTEETKKKISVANKGKKRTEAQNINNSLAKKDSKWMHKDGVQTIVMLGCIEQHLQDGWVFGMLEGRKSSPASEERKRNISNSLTGKKHTREHTENHILSLVSKNRHWYTNGIDNILLSESDSVPNGFNLGRVTSEESKEKNRKSHLGKTAWNKGLKLK